MNLYPWQEKLLVDIETSGRKPGELMVMFAGRRTGKSIFTDKALRQLIEDINRVPITELITSEGRVYGARYYCVEPVGGNWREIEDWCIETYGPSTGSIWAQEVDKTTPLQCERWYANIRKFWFRNEADLTLFILKWQK